eukprot:5411673-Heterocapsa_arctica.AAC.1
MPRNNTHHPQERPQQLDTTITPEQRRSPPIDDGSHRAMLNPQVLDHGSDSSINRDVGGVSDK